MFGLPLPMVLFLLLLVGSTVYKYGRLTWEHYHPPAPEPEPPVLVPFSAAVRAVRDLAREIDAGDARTLLIQPDHAGEAHTMPIAGSGWDERPTVNLGEHARRLRADRARRLYGRHAA